MDNTMLPILVVILGLTCVEQSVGLTKPTSVKLVDNGYTGVVFAIHEDEPENEELIEELKITMTRASAYLYEATNHRAYFEEVMILIPGTWKDKAEYQSPRNATFEGADAIVAARNPRFAPNEGVPPIPHTKHYEGCGKRAVHIHLTSDFLLNEYTETYYGEKGRVLVHEWAHYRWGLFNEYADAIGDPDYYDPYYFSPTNQIWEPTRCTRGYSHYPIVFDADTNMYYHCNGNEDTGYETGCVSIPTVEQPENITASIMAGYTSIDQIVDFCDDDHNDEAPNKHNRLCGKRSNWAVMRGHEDFMNNINPSRDINDTTPTFILAKTQEIRVVLVMDTSGSMSTANRIEKASSASKDFIRSIAVDGSYVGIVDFDSYGKRLSGLTLIDSKDTRDTLAQLIPTVAGGGTCIGSGLEVALQILSENSQSPAGGLILLMTDGIDGCDEQTAQMGQRLVDEHVIVDAVTISNTADPELLALADATGGRSYLQTDASISTGLHDAFVGTMQSGVKLQDRRVEIHRESSSYAVDEGKNHGVFIDETVGNKTAFEFSYYIDADPVLEVTVTSPSNFTYGSDYHGYTADTQFKVISLKFKTTEPGLWTFTVANLHHSAHDVFSNVYTYPSQEGVNPIIATSELSGSTTDFASGEPLIAFAEVVQGFYPVIRAKVTAIIERPPDAQGTPYDPYEMELFDNGAGADITKDDGIYSRYFTEFTGIGFYGIKINIENTAETLILDGSTPGPYSYTLAFVDPVELLEGDIPTIEGEAILLPGMPVPEPQGSPAPNFTRGISGGSSQVPETPENWVPGDDIIAPSKIVDLRVTSSSYNNRTVTLEFTAPGDDLDSGNASYYVMRMSESPDELQNYYNSISPVNESTILYGDTSSPGLFGDHQRFTLSVPVPDNETVVSYTFAMHAVDETGNEGEMSNLAQATLREYIPPPLTEPPPTTEEDPTTTGEPSSTTNKPTKEPAKKDLLWLWIMLGVLGALAVGLPLVIVLYRWFSRKTKDVNEEGKNGRRPNRDVEGTDNSSYTMS